MNTNIFNFLVTGKACDHAKGKLYVHICFESRPVCKMLGYKVYFEINAIHLMLLPCLILFPRWFSANF